MTERWKSVEGYENLYEVSDQGRVKSLLGWNGAEYLKREFIMNPSASKPIKDKPYSRMKVNLTKDGHFKGFMVHRLVAKAFVHNPDNKPHVNHKDGNPLNNHYANLEWCTQKENVRHAIETGLNVRPWDLVEREQLVDMLNSGWNYQEIADYYEVAKGTIFNYIKKLEIKTKYY